MLLYVFHSLCTCYYNMHRECIIFFCNTFNYNPFYHTGMYLDYRDWPTIPQLYVNKEFIGGCDIVTTMFREGELETLFKDLNLIGDATEEK